MNFVCPKCKKIINDSYKFCPGCGYRPDTLIRKNREKRIYCS